MDERKNILLFSTKLLKGQKKTFILFFRLITDYSAVAWLSNSLLFLWSTVTVAATMLLLQMELVKCNIVETYFI